MAKVRWRLKSLYDLDRLDRWRESELGVPPIGPVMIMLVEEFFAQVSLSHHLVGAPVSAGGERLDVRLLLMPLRSSEPYKIFYRPLPADDIAEVRRIRHPRQKPLKRL